MGEYKQNFCCDCGWVVKKGILFKKWFCTNPEFFEPLEIDPITGRVKK